MYVFWLLCQISRYWSCSGLNYGSSSLCFLGVGIFRASMLTTDKFTSPGQIFDCQMGHIQLSTIHLYISKCNPLFYPQNIVPPLVFLQFRNQQHHILSISSQKLRELILEETFSQRLLLLLIEPFSSSSVLCLRLIQTQ